MTFLFLSKSTFSFEEYRKFSRMLLHERKIDLLIGIWTVVILILAAAFIAIDSVISVACLVLGVVSIAFAMSYIGELERRRFSGFGEQCGLESSLLFFDDHVTKNNALGGTVINYSDIDRIVETKTNIYLMTGKSRGIIIEKNNCSDKLLDFVRALKQS